MHILRNPEIKKEVILYTGLTLAAVVLTLLLTPETAMVPLIMGILFLLLRLSFYRKSIRRMEELSLQIDRILHGQERLLIADNDEGELAVLSSEIQKMTIRLREQADLLQADKVRMSDAIADISHQLRTPLTAMRLDVDRLRKEDLSYEERLRITQGIRRQVDRIRWLIEALLKISKIDAGTVAFSRETISVKELFEKATEPFLIPCELRDQRLELIASEESFVGDAAWTVEAVGNLLKNCMEHTPEGGRITLKASETALYTMIEVSDTGEGFAKEDIPNLFHRFFKGQNAGADSIGIGLALSQMIIASQDGTIVAENKPEGGARFEIRFYKSVV